MNNNFNFQFLRRYFVYCIEKSSSDIMHKFHIYIYVLRKKGSNMTFKSDTTQTISASALQQLQRLCKLRQMGTLCVANFSDYKGRISAELMCSHRCLNMAHPCIFIMNYSLKCCIFNASVT